MIILCGCVISQQAQAQLNASGSLYFQNPYLVNPAMAGVNEGMSLNMNYIKQLINVPGAPVIQTLTADYGFSPKVGAGINVYNDKAGLFRRTKVTGTYAYHLKLNSEEQRIHFGLSMGFMNERISIEDLSGDASDMDLLGYNQQKTYIDGDFGLGYTDTRLTLQLAVPNLKNFTKKEVDDRRVADRSTFFAATSYKIGNENFIAEPMLAFRGIKGYNSIIDGGVRVGVLKNQVSVTGIYHSTNSITTGIGVRFKAIELNGMYSTATSHLSNYTNGNMEIGLKLRLADERSRLF